ncbi:MAG TPA: 30S ribosomal protein S7 [Oligoflexia bacterium]|nr:30S ribosomal protein S7 [Oligoflexia bacterium]HMP26502.1 30S ribosomal protein S7 [Oligoflexia bacterium]
MSRKKRDYTRKILPDPKYGDSIIGRTVNIIMKSGKKSVAEKALYDALEVIGEKTGEQPLELYNKALANCKPLVEVRSRRVGGATYQVPTEVRAFRAESLAIRWVVQAANERAERGLAEKLAAEILDASAGRGGAVKKREEVHRMAEANKAFAHFRW